MSSKKLDEVKVRLQKLIAKEESSRQLGNLAEAEAFASKIQQLLLEYQIDIEELRGKNTAYGVGKERVEMGDLVGNHEGIWAYTLYGVGAVNNFCKVIMPPSWGDNYLTLIGEETNREFTHYFVNQLISKLRNLARVSFSKYEGPDKRNTYIRSFLRGAVDGIGQRLKEDREKAMANTPQVMGLVKNNSAAIIRFMEENYRPGSLGKTRTTQTSSSVGYGNGVQAGRGVSINKGVSGNKGYGGTKLLN
jgi:hypothetical protein